MPAVTTDPNTSPCPDWQSRLAVRAGLLAGVLGLAGFALALLSPQEFSERADHPLWLTAALLAWVSTCLATVFLFGWAATARRPALAGRLALALALVATAAASMAHTRALVDYAAVGIDPAFGAALHDTQTPIATTVAACIALAGAGGWLVVALTSAPGIGASRLARTLVALAGLGIMLPVPVTAVALLAASTTLRWSRTTSYEERPAHATAV
jgi:hypothetical protein